MLETNCRLSSVAIADVLRVVVPAVHLALEVKISISRRSEIYCRILLAKLGNRIHYEGKSCFRIVDIQGATHYSNESHLDISRIESMAMNVSKCPNRAFCER